MNPRFKYLDEQLQDDILGIVSYIKSKDADKNTIEKLDRVIDKICYLNSQNVGYRKHISNEYAKNELKRKRAGWLNR